MKITSWLCKRSLVYCCCSFLHMLMVSTDLVGWRVLYDTMIFQRKPEVKEHRLIFGLFFQSLCSTRGEHGPQIVYPGASGYTTMWSNAHAFVSFWKRPMLWWWYEPNSAVHERQQQYTIQSMKTCSFLMSMILYCHMHLATATCIVLHTSWCLVYLSNVLRYYFTHIIKLFHI